MYEAFSAWAEATPDNVKPEEYDELLPLAEGMAHYYTEHWLTKRRKDFQTVWLDDTPQVEVDFNIPIPGLVDTTFTGTFDRIVQDPYGRWWIAEYKTAAQIDTSKLDTDPQVTAYMLAATNHYSALLNRPVEFEGVVYMQWAKNLARPPRVLVNGEVSVAQNQRTSYSLYRETLVNTYGGVPKRYIPALNKLAEQETPNGDRYVRIDLVRRNRHHIAAEIEKLYAEALEMLNPDLPLYPNPTRDCSWDCQFKQACLAMDEGYPPEDLLDEEFRYRPEGEERTPWANALEPAAPNPSPWATD